MLGCLKALKEEINDFEIIIKNKINQSNFLERELRRKEQEIGEFHATIKQLEERIYSGEVTTVKELNILKEKQKAMQLKIEKYEEKALDILEEIDALDLSLPKEKELTFKKKKEYSKKQLQTSQEIDKMSAELQVLQRHKLQRKTKISPNLLDKYYKIKKIKRNPIAMAVEGKCSGCMMGISVMLVLEVERHENIIYCENCGRLLV